MRGRDCKGGARVGAERRAAVEADPADPEQARADHRQRQVMGGEIVGAVTVAFAEHIRRDQTCNPRVEVDDRAAGEIENAGTGEKATTPHPMRDRHVDEEQPPGDEPQERGKPHAVCDRARDQRNRDDRKRHLINHIQELRNGRRKYACRLHADAAQKHPLECSEPGRITGKTQAVADGEPQKRAQGGAGDALRHGCEHVLLAHHSAIEQRQPWDGHHQHERGRRDHPGGVAPVDLRCHLLRQCRPGGEDQAQRGGNAARHATDVSRHAVPLNRSGAYNASTSVSPVLMRTA